MNFLAKPVVLDARHLKSGIGTFARKLLEHVPMVASDLKFVALVRSVDRIGLPRHANLQYKPVEAEIYGVREQILVPIGARGASLLHSLHYNVSIFHPGRSVVTIHDLTHLMFPEMLPSRAAWLYAKTMIKRAVTAADRIVVDSAFTMTQLLEQLRVPESKIRVIHLGLDPVGSPTPDLESSGTGIPAVGGPYLLYVGNVKEHKNLHRLVRAFALLRYRHQVPHRLVIAGGGESQKLRQTAAEAGVSDWITFTGFVSDDVLHSWYSRADAFVMPSLSEGFGFPALEALSWDTPVAAARASALPEILGDAALFFDPLDIDDMAEALWRILDQENLRSALRARGRQLLHLYSWQECARKYAETYREVLLG